VKAEARIYERLFSYAQPDPGEQPEVDDCPRGAVIGQCEAGRQAPV